MPAKSDISPPDLNAMLCFAIHSTGFAFNQIYRRPLKKLGVTYPQYLVMTALWGEDNVTVGHLCEQLSLDTGTLTPLLKRLEAMGLLTRKRSKVDERRVMIALTEQGRAMKRKAAEIALCVAESVGLSLAQISRLTRDIRALRQNLRRAADRDDTPKKRTAASHER